MEDKYIQDGKKVKDKTEEQKNIELVVSILKTKRDLDMANHNFEFAERIIMHIKLKLIKVN